MTGPATGGALGELGSGWPVRPERVEEIIPENMSSMPLPMHAEGRRPEETQRRICCSWASLGGGRAPEDAPPAAVPAAAGVGAGAYFGVCASMICCCFLTKASCAASSWAEGCLQVGRSCLSWPRVMLV